jgi:hypothetical protein
MRGLSNFRFHGLDFPKIVEKKVWAVVMLSPIEQLKRTAYNLFSKNISIEKIEGDGNFLFFIESNLRADHQKNYERIISVLDNKPIGQLILKIKERRPSLCTAWSSIRKLFKILKALNKVSTSFYGIPASLALASEILLMERFYDALTDVTITEKCLVVFHDASALQQILCQILSSTAVKTITLQHGLFIEWPFPGQHTSDYENTVADYFFAWGQSTKELIERYNPTIRVIKVGHPYLIDCQMPNYLHSNCFGIILCAPAFRDDNRRLVQLAGAISQAIHKSYWIKIHPADNPEYYEDVLQPGCKGFIGKETSITQYAERVEFSITNPSSLLFQLLALNHLTLKYGPAYASDPQASEWISVSDVPSFMSEYQRFDEIRDSGAIQAFINRYFEPGDVRLNYQRAFKQVLEESAAD